jgi:hypothetical protein
LIYEYDGGLLLEHEGELHHHGDETRRGAYDHQAELPDHPWE